MPVFCLTEPAGSCEGCGPGAVDPACLLPPEGNQALQGLSDVTEREPLTHTMRTQVGGQLSLTLPFHNLYEVYAQGGRQPDHLSFHRWVEEPWRFLNNSEQKPFTSLPTGQHHHPARPQPKEQILPP